MRKGIDAVWSRWEWVRTTRRIVRCSSMVRAWVIEPAAVSLSPGEQLDFDARGADAYGNLFALTGANVAWHCVPATLGTITAAGFK